MVTDRLGSIAKRLKSLSSYGSCTSRIANSDNCLGSQSSMVTIRLGSTDRRFESIGDHLMRSPQDNDLELTPMRYALGYQARRNQLEFNEKQDR